MSVVKMMQKDLFYMLYWICESENINDGLTAVGFLEFYVIKMANVLNWLI